jgi:hypothetical protein
MRAAVGYFLMYCLMRVYRIERRTVRCGWNVSGWKNGQVGSEAMVHAYVELCVCALGIVYYLR